MNRFDFFKPTLGQAWIMVGLFFAGGIVAGVISTVLKLCFSINLELVSLSYVILQLPPMIYIFAMAGKSWPDDPLPLNSPDFGRLGVFSYVGLAVAGMLLLSLLAEPLTAFIPMPESIKAIFEAEFVNSALWDNVLGACILAPLCEEFLCRGMMMRGMLLQMSPKKAILWSAFIFAVLHMNPWQSIPAFLMGIFLGWTYYRSGSLWVPIALHCVNNSLSTVLIHIFPDMGVDTGLIDLLPTGTYIVVYVLSAAVFAVILNVLRKNDEKTLSSQIHSGGSGESLGE